MKRLPNDNILKRQLISRYLWPGLGLNGHPDHGMTVDFAHASTRLEVVKYEHFELAGVASDGHAYFFEHALSHSYYHYADTGDEQGVCIYRPHELIFEGDSLLHREDRLASLQALEPGGLLAIPYPALRVYRLADRGGKAGTEAGAYPERRGPLAWHASRIAVPAFQGGTSLLAAPTPPTGTGPAYQCFAVAVQQSAQKIWRQWLKAAGLSNFRQKSSPIMDNQRVKYTLSCPL